ncbi:MAG: BLUF domain-containing protein [Pseudolabrys sp.]|nr:BLUF domain-containing protein [Pseudolabrys sp.]
MLTRLIYHSENHLGTSGGRMIADLNKIMDASNRNNETAGITGALMFDTMWFVQILEGEREALSRTLRRIMADERHDAVTIMDAREVTERRFGNWWMGLAMLHGDSGELYARHGLGPRFDPRKLTGDQTVTLALDLAQSGLNRRLAA